MKKYKTIIEETMTINQVSLRKPDRLVGERQYDLMSLAKQPIVIHYCLECSATIDKKVVKANRASGYEHRGFCSVKCKSKYLLQLDAAKASTLKRFELTDNIYTDKKNTPP